MTDDAPHTVRRLMAGDVDVFRELLVVFGHAFEDSDTYSGAQPRDAYLEDLLGSDHFIALVALRDDAVVGGIAAYELKKFERERSEFYIYDLAVAAEYRRKGIATDLIRQLQTIAASRAGYVIFVQADRGDQPAIELYTKLGTREDVIHFDIDVG